MVKQKKPHSESRWREARIAIRIHEDLRDAIEFLATDENRRLSNMVEILLIEGVKARLSNNLSNRGERLDNQPWEWRQETRGGPRGRGRD